MYKFNARTKTNYELYSETSKYISQNDAEEKIIYEMLSKITYEIYKVKCFNIIEETKRLNYDLHENDLFIELYVMTDKERTDAIKYIKQISEVIPEHFKSLLTPLYKILTQEPIS